MRIPLLILIFFVAITPGMAQQESIKARTEDGEIPVFEMETIYILSTFASDKQRKQYLKQQEKFNRLRYNVHKVYPYVKIFSRYFLYLHNTLITIEDPEVRQAYKKMVEKELFGKYEADLRDMTITQGRILIKLLHREAGQTAYQGIKDLKSGTVAFFWQGVARIFGNNLKSEYDPEEEADIERILQELEQQQARR